MILYLHLERRRILHSTWTLEFLFSGKYLRYRQYCNVDSLVDKELFFNLASYGNKRLYDHICKSFMRNTSN